MFIRLASIFQKIEDSILVCLMLTMISLAVFQIFLRNFFDAGIVWADPLVRILSTLDRSHRCHGRLKN